MKKSLIYSEGCKSQGLGLLCVTRLKKMSKPYAGQRRVSQRLFDLKKKMMRNNTAVLHDYVYNMYGMCGV